MRHQLAQYCGRVLILDGKPSQFRDGRYLFVSPSVRPYEAPRSESFILDHIWIDLQAPPEVVMDGSNFVIETLVKKYQRIDRSVDYGLFLHNPISSTLLLKQLLKESNIRFSAVQDSLNKLCLKLRPEVASGYQFKHVGLSILVHADVLGAAVTAVFNLESNISFRDRMITARVMCEFGLKALDFKVLKLSYWDFDQSRRFFNLYLSSANQTLERLPDPKPVPRGLKLKPKGKSLSKTRGFAVHR